MQVDAADNPAIEPLVDVLKNVMKPDEKFDMSGSTFKVWMCKSICIYFAA